MVGGFDLRSVQAWKVMVCRWYVALLGMNEVGREF
jgi:hypothetical protein